LACRPKVHGEEYHTRKGQYALSALLIVDDNKCIHHATVGWTGSIHDNRVWTGSKFAVNPFNYFSANEYALGGSAFTNSLVIATSYKRSSGQAALPIGQSWFNDLMNCPRSMVENVIGIWKGCFPWLWNIQFRIINKSSMVKLIKYVTATIILHNLTIKNQYNDDRIHDDSDEEDDYNDNDGLNVNVHPAVENNIHSQSIHNTYIVSFQISKHI
jgi:hypothetical protein